MASSIRHFLSAGILLTLLSAAAGVGAPTYCQEGQAIPHHPLPNCRWYVSSRACSVSPCLPLPVMKERCCRELEAVTPECRCKALRLMMVDNDMPILPGVWTEARRECCHGQAEFAATIVMEKECGLVTIHGSQLCYALGAED